MHIADVTMFYSAQGGGVLRYIEAKRAWLNAHSGYSHTLLVPGQRARSEPGIVRVPSLPLAHGYRIAINRRAAARALVELHPSLIEAGDPYQLAWASLDAARTLHIPTVAFCHSDLPSALRLRLGAAAERVGALYYRHLYRRFDLVLAPSATMTARLREWGIANAHHQPLGVDLELFNPQRRDLSLRQELAVASDTRLLVYVGRFAPEKNLGVLVQALEKLGSKYLLLLVGAGSAPSNLPQNVRIVSYVADRPALARLIASCDLFVHGGDQETFGLAALEAMASGVPVVGARAAGIAELVTAEGGILVRPRDPSALAEAVEGIYQRDIAAIGAQARCQAEHYGWPRVLAQIVRRYVELIAASAKDPALEQAVESGCEGTEARDPQLNAR